MLLVGGGMSMGLRTERFFCDRTAGKLPTCTLSVSAPFEQKTVFPAEAIDRVKMSEYKKSNKSPTVYIAALSDRNGTDTPIVRHADRADALAERDRLQAFLDDDRAQTFLRETPPEPYRYVLLVAVIAMGIGICGWGVFSRRTKSREADSPG